MNSPGISQPKYLLQNLEFQNFPFQNDTDDTQKWYKVICNKGWLLRAPFFVPSSWLELSYHMRLRNKNCTWYIAVCHQWISVATLWGPCAAVLFVLCIFHKVWESWTCFDLMNPFPKLIEKSKFLVIYQSQHQTLINNSVYCLFLVCSFMNYKATLRDNIVKIWHR